MKKRRLALAISRMAFWVLASKAAFGVAYAVRRWDELGAPNADDVVGYGPAVMSGALLGLALLCPRHLRLGRLWSWLMILGAAGFANRALPIYTYEWVLVAIPAALLVREGGWIRLLRSKWLALRAAAAGLAVALVPLVTVWFDPLFTGQVAAEQLACFGGSILAAASMTYALRPTRRLSPCQTPST